MGDGREGGCCYGFCLFVCVTMIYIISDLLVASDKPMVSGIAVSSSNVSAVPHAGAMLAGLCFLQSAKPSDRVLGLEIIKAAYFKL